jgi:hypothetical protein
MADFIAMLPTQTLAEVERAYILTVMDATRGNKSETAKILGINYSTLWRKIKKDKALRHGNIAAYRKPKVKTSALLRDVTKAATPKSKPRLKPLTAEKKREVDSYIEDIYNSLNISS